MTLVEFTVPTLDDLSKVWVPSEYSTVVVERYDFWSHKTFAKYKAVTEDPQHHKLCTRDLSGAWWEICEPVITPAMAGARYNHIFEDWMNATDDTDAFNRMFDYIRLLMHNSRGTRGDVYFGNYGTGRCLIAGSINATGIRGTGITGNEFYGSRIDGNGCILVGVGAGNVTLDLTHSRSLDLDGICIHGEPDDPPDIGIMNSRREDGAASNRFTFEKCKATGVFRFAPKVTFACELQAESRCTWQNLNDGSNVAARDGRVFAEVITGSMWYPEVMKSKYQPIVREVGAADSFNEQSRRDCSWICWGSSKSYGLLLSRTERLRIESGYSQIGIVTALVYVGQSEVLRRIKQWHIDLHGEGEVQSWFQFEPGPDSLDTDLDVQLIDCEFQDHATQGVYPNGVFDISDLRIASTSFHGGFIRLGRYSAGPPSALFSAGKVSLFNDVSIPTGIVIPERLEKFGGKIFLAGSGTYYRPNIGYTEFRSDKSVPHIKYGVHGPIIEDTSILTANRHRRFSHTGSQVPGSQIEFIHKGIGADGNTSFKFAIFDWELPVPIFIRYLNYGERMKLTWTGTNWEEL